MPDVDASQPLAPISDRGPRLGPRSRSRSCALAGELLPLVARSVQPAAGGGGALVGIVWLHAVFGVYFGARLGLAGQGPRRPWLGAGLALAAIAVLPAAHFAAVRLGLAGTDLGSCSSSPSRR